MVGDHDVTTGADSLSTVVHDIIELIVHEGYVSATNQNDIGLVRVKQIAYNEHVGPVCLPWSLASTNFDDKIVTVAGWGATELSGPLSKYLRKVDLRVTTQAKCKEAYPFIDDKMMCTKGEDKDSCQVR